MGEMELEIFKFEWDDEKNENNFRSLKKLSKMSYADIDFSDIPALTKEELKKI